MSAALCVLAQSVGGDVRFGKQTYFFEELAASAANLGVSLTFLTEGDDSPSVAAYRFDGTWKRTQVSACSLVYDRFLAASARDLERYERIASHLPAGARYLNPPELVRLVSDKQAFHDFLRVVGLPTLPSFLLSRATEDEIFRLLDSAHEVYVKPLKGLRGEGILVITGLSSDRRLRRANGDLLLSVSSASELLQVLREMFAGKDAVLMQRASESRISDAPFDVRALVQSTEPGSYSVTGMGTRVGGCGTWVSNLASGGEALSLEELAPRLPASLRLDGGALRREIETLSLACAGRLEGACGAFAEIALDFVLDSSGWILLEANAKPGRWLFTALADRFPFESPEARRSREMRRRSVEAPLLFAGRLAL